ncbi:galactoside O-acetyltransferase [Andreesenia angusta]|uniref:Galactoside O-acetyltransferase n=1 Tax=Andreesenia angusta TaxID=39480 RepID=A0A1S1V5S6_9FIRM|nr:acyltransferase [Andreesenia angusta]OHW61973.1 galactoside O-acetyltransferase [Andreesenia angusta]
MKVFKNRIGPDIILTHWMLYFKGLKKILYRKMNKVGKNVEIRPFVTIVGTDNVEIGDNVTLRPFTSIYAENNENKRVLIEKDVLIGPNVYMTTSNHEYRNPNKKICEQGHRFDNIVVKEGAWIGYGCIILPGVTIGKHSVIGAGSVVTKSIEDYSVAVGCPARVIKSIK